MLTWIRQMLERRREKKKSELPLAFSGEHAFTGSGRISVDVERLLKSPGFQEQVRAIEFLRRESPDGTITIDLDDPDAWRYLGPEVRLR